ncbi:MAG: TonB-dependent receptor [Bacteroidota bacterium]
MTRLYALSLRCCAVLALLVIAAPLAAAQTTGKIAGSVTDFATGDPLPGVNVVIEGTTTGASTDFDGEFVIIGVRPGTYTLIASYIGYAQKSITGVRVNVDLTTSVDFELQEEAFEGQEVVVTADRDLVRRDLTSSEFRVTSETIENLPVQEVGDILSAQAGVTTSGGGIHIRGGRSKEVAYFVDGVRVSDAYDGSVSVQIENDGIEELQIIAGTFNAEYGQAMSGIINVVTKDPANEFSGNIDVFSGTYAVTGDGGADLLRSANEEAYETRNDIRYFGVDPFSYLDVNPVQYYQLQGSLTGPVVPDLLGFYVLGRYFKNDGWLSGARVFNPDGTPGDSALVPMNEFEKLSGQATLKSRLGNGMSLSLTALGSYATGDDLGFGAGNYLPYRQNPDGLANFFETGYNVNLQFQHTVSSKLFYTVNVATAFKQFERYAFEDPLDQRYWTPFAVTAPDSLNGELLIQGGNRFLRGGYDLGRFERSTASYTIKSDLTTQLFKNHLVKGGIEFRIDDLFLEGFSLTEDETTQDIANDLRIPDETSNSFQRFDGVNPISVSAYVQDKIEYENFIVNAGIRFDYFDSRGQTPADEADPNIFNPFRATNRFNDLDGNGVITSDEEFEENRLSIEDREAYWYNDAEAKIQVSPRLGVAYPITADGVIHFSYGHFLQVPTFEFLFNNPGYRVRTTSGTYGPFGNANIDPQKTVMYEIGLQQGFGDDYLLDVTGFYRDVRDWVSVSDPIDTVLPGVQYLIYTNRDYSNVRGITVALSKRFSQGFSFDVDYTFQVAEGSNSSPEEAIAARQGNDAPRLQLIPLEWDQRHTFNASLFFGGNRWGASTLLRYGAGYPYSPAARDDRILPAFPTNSERRPTTFNADLYAFYDLPLPLVTPRVFLQVFNLFDARNANAVYGDTGQPDVTLRGPAIASTDAGYFTRPNFYSEPRRLHLGLQLSF